MWFEEAEMEDEAIQCPVSSHQHIPLYFTLSSVLAEGLCFMIYLPLVSYVNIRDGRLQVPRLPHWPSPHCTLRGTVSLQSEHPTPFLLLLLKE